MRGNWMTWMRVLGGAVLLGVGAGAVGFAARVADENRTRARWDSLATGAEPARDEVTRPAGTRHEATARFDSTMVEGLPAPARRYLLHAMAEGTPLRTTVTARMSGEIQLRADADPMRMSAEQVVQHGEGFIWRALATDGPMRIRGYDRYVDGEGRMRWWLWGSIPVVSEDGEDVTRSAAGRMAMESALFVPATLLPAYGATWEAVDDRRARVRIAGGAETEPVELEVDGEGRLVRLSLDRWNGDPANGPVGRLPFVAERFSEERTFDGYTLPTRMRVGWRLGEPGSYAFFRPVLEAVEYR